MVFLSLSTFGPSGCVMRGAGDVARERGQTSSHTNSSSAFLRLASFSLVWQSNRTLVRIRRTKKKLGLPALFDCAQSQQEAVSFFRLSSFRIVWHRITCHLFLYCWRPWPADCQPLLLHMKQLPGPGSDKQGGSGWMLREPQAPKISSKTCFE